MKKFEVPEIEVSRFEVEDHITTSDGEGRENELEIG